LREFNLPALFEEFSREQGAADKEGPREEDGHGYL
jgi:hypothetical protein